ncbi:hypothetical protein Tco_0401110, partial [Tanacetum coccineum]
FDTGVFDEQEVEVEKVVSTAKVTTASATTTTVDELTLAQSLIEIKAAKPKAVTRPKARGVVVQEPSEFTTTTSPSQSTDSFVPIDTEVVEGSKSHAEGSKKRTREELESDNSKKQKIDENVEAEVDDEAEMKKHMEIVPDDEVAIDAIPLATKSPIIIDWKIIKEGKMGYFQIIRADGSSRRPEEAYERVLWGDLKVMFEPDVESEVWRNLQGYNVTVWKLFSSSGVHFVRFQNLHIFMLVEKKYPLTPATITKMLNKKLQTDHWNEMCYQLLKLMTKQRKNPGSNEENILSSYHCLYTVSTAGVEVNAAELKICNHSNEPSSSKLVLKVVALADKTATSQQELELLFSPMYEEYFNAGNPSLSKSSTLSDNLQQHDTQSTTNIHPTLELIIPPTNVNAEEKM